MLDKLEFNALFIVEGRDDKTLLEQIVDDPIYVLHGYRGISKKRLENIQKLAKNREVILLLDPDFAGHKMRDIICSKINNVHSINVPRKLALKKDNVGIENTNIDDLYDILKKFLKTFKSKKIQGTHVYTTEDMLSFHLIGNKQNREIVSESLNFGYFNAKQLLKNLNKYKIPYTDFLKTFSNIYDKGAIFGKFIPPHLGHLEFIKNASFCVKELIVFLCVDEDRDEKLLDNSTLPKRISVQDRYSFLKNDILELKNVTILILDEKGIASYPNGWLDWSNRVKEKLQEAKKNISVIFTNEPQDIPNYKEYFGVDTIYFDLERNNISISATKIRNDYNKNKKYLSEKTLKFFEEHNG